MTGKSSRPNQKTFREWLRTDFERFAVVPAASGSGFVGLGSGGAGSVCLGREVAEHMTLHRLKGFVADVVFNLAGILCRGFFIDAEMDQKLT